ncbi:GIY-YIG nuclease family protein [Polluticoccus soli]|uniref:GIY-YIG nuclease family protein n=1 Tax=Polluticoccus soli TaxID=3034150 RepID=UPI0023E09075|nr:GIY-YIG nuclease family protein [Flavipsychrobacter sp. JY13-12]
MYKGGTVYILSSVSKRVLYTGVTSDLERRMIEHKSKAFPGSFSAQNNCCQLVYYKHFGSIEEAIAEEKRIKGGKRKQKESLIAGINPNWSDLSLTLTDWWPEQW